MKKITYLISVFTILFFTNTFAQKPILEISFTSLYYGQYVSLDSIMIKNLCQGSDTMLYAPDTTLVLEYIVGITNNEGIGKNSISVSQNYPNPVTKGQTTIEVYLPEKEQLKIQVVDILGRMAARYNSKLNAGKHVFTFYPGKEKHYVFSAFAGNSTQTIKITSLQSNTNSRSRLLYNGNKGIKTNMKSAIGNSNFTFALGDTLRYVGYASTPAGIRGSNVIDDAPLDNNIVEFEIIEGIPCPGIAAITYHGQTYTTVQIFNQCWFKENLNYEKNNSWCYNNEQANCDTYGRLYKWQTAQTVCPPGWHLPSDDEWKILEGNVDTEYGVGSSEWEKTGWRGFDAGKHLKTIIGWDNNGNGDNSSGFTALPGGYFLDSWSFYYLGSNGYFWSSSKIVSWIAWYRHLRYYLDNIGRYATDCTYGFSVRCLKD